MRIKLTLVLVFSISVLRSQPIAPYSVVIDEIMADPAPPVSLPNAEYIELRNTSHAAIDLRGWQLGDNSGVSFIKNGFLLQPDSTVIVCSSAAGAALSAFGPVLVVSNFPSLNNDADAIFLRSPDGRSIHAVAYNAAWYQNPVKNNGGWSLEMIDVHNACSGITNWKASIDPRGGTPGQINSVDGINPDNDPPQLLDAWAPDSFHVYLRFDEALDSNSAVRTDGYELPEAVLQKVALPGPFFETAMISLTSPLQNNKVYTIKVNAATDCAGNAIGSLSQARFGRSLLPVTNDLAINEILFNPRPDGVDYIEIYNRGKAIINLKEVFLTTRNASGVLNTAQALSSIDRLILPGDYRVFCSDPITLQRQYLVKDPHSIISLASMPSLPDDRGDLVLLNVNGQILDELSYDAHWQFPLLATNEGVALERIDYNKPTQSASNWHSAAETAGFGTPGYRNSQYLQDGLSDAAVSVEPAIFSPDNDGYADVLSIAYHFPEPGNVCSITIFDVNGRPVRYLTHNALCGREGVFRWDGLSEQQQQLPVGVYIVIGEVFGLQGKTHRYRLAVTLARKLN